MWVYAPIIMLIRRSRGDSLHKERALSELLHSVAPLCICETFFLKSINEHVMLNLFHAAGRDPAILRRPPYATLAPEMRLLPSCSQVAPSRWRRIPG
jgi:hypothetical protein